MRILIEFLEFASAFAVFYLALLLAYKLIKKIK